jgi:hypothetical protein
MKNVVLCLLCVAVSPWASAQSTQDFGDYVVRCNAMSTQHLTASVAKQYGIDRSVNRGLLNISVESKTGGEHTVKAAVTAQVGDLTGHEKPVAIKETSENGDIDYLGEFPIDSSGTYVFTVKVSPSGQAPFVVKFTQDLAAD